MEGLKQLKYNLGFIILILLLIIFVPKSGLKLLKLNWNRNVSGQKQLWHLDQPSSQHAL